LADCVPASVPLDLYPVYVRGQAYLAARQGGEAAAEFGKIIAHRALVLNSLIGALAHLGLARARALQGDAEKARSAYEDFLTLWQDADAGIPVLKKAKAEYRSIK
jgi:ATP/maltotriose-dependent transcriptional regulator MalT